MQQWIERKLLKKTQLVHACKAHEQSFPFDKLRLRISPADSRSPFDRLRASLTPAKRLNLKPAPILPRDFQRRL